MRAEHPERVYRQFVDRALLETWDDPLTFREERLLALLRPKSTVLSVGSGRGREVQFLLERGCSVVCLDPSPVAARILQKRFGKRVALIRGRLGEGRGAPVQGPFGAVVALGNVTAGLLTSRLQRGFFSQWAELLQEGCVGVLDLVLAEDGQKRVCFRYPLPSGKGVEGVSWRPSKLRAEELLKNSGLSFRWFDWGEDRWGLACRRLGNSPSFSSSWTGKG